MDEQDKTVEEQVAEIKAKAAESEEPKAAVDPVIEVPNAQRDIASAIMRILVEKRDNFANAVSAMIASRQLYAVAVRELEMITSAISDAERHSLFRKALEALENKPEEPPDALATFELVEEMLIQAAAYGAAKPFEDSTLLTGLKKSVMAWLEKTVERHNRQAAAERREQIEAWEQARRDRHVPVGVVYTSGEGASLDRSRSLILFGWRPAVLWMLDCMVTATLAARDEQVYTVVRLMRQAPKVETQPHLFRLGGKAWHDCCKSGSSWPKLFQSKVLPQLTDPPDLLVVDDLAYAGESTSLLGGSPARMAGNSHRRFREWCNKTGCALLGAVLFDSKEALYPGNVEWEQLRTFTTLRYVGVKEDGDFYHLTIGRDVSSCTVEKKILDSYGTSSIIVPNSDQGIVS